MPECTSTNPSRNNNYLRLFAWVSAIYFLFLCVESSAQRLQCDRQLTPTQDGVGYVLRNDRCEGMYVSPVSVLGGLELLSLTKGRLQYNLEPGEHITLTAANSGLEQTVINVRALATSLRTYYRMDTVLSPGQRWTWPVDEVLLPLHLTSNRLGIYSWAETTSAKVFVPIEVNQPSTKDIYLSVRPTLSVQNVMWRASSLRGGQRSSTGWQNVVSQALAGETIHIVLPKGNRGLLDVEVAATVGNDDWVKLRMKVWCE